MKNARRIEWKTRREYALLVCIGLGLWLLCARPLCAQTPDSGPIFHVQTALTLVDGVAIQRDPSTHNPVLLTDLRQTDFRLFDNDREVRIQSFDTGATLRPIVLWLIVQCNMGFPDDWGSGFLRGNTQYLKPALQHLNKDDLIGVAHWCDNGDSRIDSGSRIDAAPGNDVDAALQRVEEILGTERVSGDNRTGELAMQRMIRSIDVATREARPPHAVGLQIRPEMDSSRLPVFLFLYGDHCATFTQEANAIIQDVMESSGMVFGLSSAKSPWGPSEGERMGKTWNLVHYYAQNTGGVYNHAPRPELFTPILDDIITQVHLRYTLGFKPSELDGKIHDLRVELTKDAQKRFPKTTLRFRREYIPLPPAQ
jgi:hypothetical protein